MVQNIPKFDTIQLYVPAFMSIGFVYRGHKDLDHDKNKFIYSKAIWLTRN